MPKKNSAFNIESNVETIERRKHWRDRRVESDRRNPERLRVAYDCRSGVPRRESDLAGELPEGDIWWDKKEAKYE